jgi:hypothetical protein
MVDRIRQIEADGRPERIDILRYGLNAPEASPEASPVAASIGDALGLRVDPGPAANAVRPPRWAR